MSLPASAGILIKRTSAPPLMDAALLPAACTCSAKPSSPLDKNSTRQLKLVRAVIWRVMRFLPIPLQII